MTNIYETTIIVKPDLANDQMKNLTLSIDNFFSENKAILPFEVDNKTKTFENKIQDGELVQVSKEEEN